MAGGIATQVFRRQEQESPGGGKTAAMLGMIGVQMMKPEMNEASGELDQPLVKGVIGVLPALAEPDILKHIVGLVVTPGVETLEIAGEVGIDAGQRRCPEALHKLRDAIGLFHRDISRLQSGSHPNRPDLSRRHRGGGRAASC